MSERPFPPSARRLALARRAGLSTASPVIIGGLVLATAAIGLALSFGGAHNAAARLATAIGNACAGRVSLDPIAGVHELHEAISALARELAMSVLAIGAPILAAVAVIAIAGQVAQTRAVWLPRRRIDGAPALDSGAGARTRRTALDLTFAAAVAAVVFGWLWLMAPRFAALFALDLHDVLSAAGALLLAALAAIAIAYLALGIIDALSRHLALARSLAMTATEKREDDRLAAADPRWARQRSALARPSLEGATLLVLGDDVAVAIAWDARRRPVPARIATGRRAYATQLVGLARRHGVPVHRDATLAASLAGAEGPVPAADWPALATVIAALRR
ncbi:MAG TPA: EscU/YscU/HrcU family type III secretion system export apparatus switch protein [Kofleriaceae bacterium]|jgi:flagellar biosynthesis protein FlhB|nr:EscU/YscU/HrcU family type III secretion system export apparatus switch protein [Kofleriaceae bacterium]